MNKEPLGLKFRRLMRDASEEGYEEGRSLEQKLSNTPCFGGQLRALPNSILFRNEDSSEDEQAEMAALPEDVRGYVEHFRIMRQID